VSSEQKLLHDLLNQITVIAAECELMTDFACKDANARLTIIMKAAKNMEALIGSYRTRKAPQSEITPCA